VSSRSAHDCPDAVNVNVACAPPSDGAPPICNGRYYVSAPRSSHARSNAYVCAYACAYPDVKSPSLNELSFCLVSAVSSPLLIITRNDTPSEREQASIASS